MSIKRVIVLSLIAGCAPVHAEDSGFFAGLALGEARIDLGPSVYDNDFIAKVFGGYALNRYLAAEVTYLHGAEFDFGLGSPSSFQDLTLELNAINVSVVATLPLGDRVSILGKAGYGTRDIDEVLEEESPAGGSRVARSYSDEDVSYGAGVQFNLKRFLSLRLEYEEIELAGELDFYTMTFGALWKF